MTTNTEHTLELNGGHLYAADPLSAETVYEHLTGQCFDVSYDADWLEPGDTYAGYMENMAKVFGQQLVGHLVLKDETGKVLFEQQIPGSPNEKAAA